MEVGETHTQGCKFPRISTNLTQEGDGQYPNDYDNNEKVMKRLRWGVGGANGLFGWPSSRIVRVSRATGGKDRHSKVWTTKGLRDRRVRLSVDAAIHLFDLQDRLGYDQPSKAIEWLIKSAASSIDELPPINTSFCETQNQLRDEKRSSTAGTESGFDSTHFTLDANPNYQQHQHVSLSRSTCSSTSETSKGSGLSLSRSENRMKARERARERTAEKEKENESQVTHHQSVNVNAIAQNSTFTELLTGSTTTTTTGSTHQNTATGCGSEATNLLPKSSRQWNSTPMDYFASGIVGPSSSRASSSIFFGNSLPEAVMVPQFNVVGDHHPEQQHYSFVPEHCIPVVTSTESGGGSNTSNSDYNLNFSISSPTTSGLAGYNRGTLQSNSPSLFPHLQRFSPIDESANFFVWTTASNAADQKGKGKY